MDDTPTPGTGDTPRTSLRPPSRGPWVVAAIVLLALVGGIWWYLRPATLPPLAETAPQRTPTAAATPETPSGPDVGGDRMRALLEAVSPNPLYRRLSSQEDVVRRWAIVTDNVAEGVSPRKQLHLLAPRHPFTAEKRGGTTVISAASYARYDALADAVASVDAGAAAAAYRELHGMVERAYRALGYPDASLDRVTTRALQRIAQAPIPAGDVAIVDQGGVFTYADPRLEALGPVEKHLVRMGPRNARIFQEKAREILGALGFPEVPAAAGASR